MTFDVCAESAMGMRQRENSTLRREENHQKLIIDWLNSQRPGSYLRIHLEDLLVAVPESDFELRKEAGQYGTQLIDIPQMNQWLHNNGYQLKTIKIEHDEYGSWAVIERRR